MVKFDRWIIICRPKAKTYWEIDDCYNPFYTSRTAAEREADALVRMGMEVEVLHVC